ncbi:hypothetical protein BLS_003852 [Venturia inaequalis]|uniref:Zn(2)-C6 fungal-type domain-containing protein n=1 Tax=Venturia inaequalis TaxID=5025 RepID=A0A8H3V7W8_VENIN|nr:hypothetical protein BLS_003852 [Venturia inaequalis]
MTVIKSRPPNIYGFQDPPVPQTREPLTPLGERFRVTSLPHQSRRVTRKSAMPLAFDDKHLKKLLDHYCTAEKLGSWVQSAPVIAALKYWVKSTLQCHEHDDTYRSLLIPAESEEKWSDFEEDCVHVVFTRIKGEDLGEPAPDPPTSAWAYAIEQLVRESWRDATSGPLNGGQHPGQSKLSRWPCERACELLRTVYESLRSEPSSGYFANLLGSFTGERHLPLPVQSRPQSTPKLACETCRFNHIACDRAEPVCGQCKHLKVLCTKAGEVPSDDTRGGNEDSSYPFDPLFDESPPRSEPLMELVSRLAPSTTTPQSEFSFYPRDESTTATRPRLLDFASFSTTSGRAPLPNTPACRTCRGKHRGCDRVRPSCGECALRSVDCVWDRDGPGANKPLARESLKTYMSPASKKLTKPPGVHGNVLEEGEIDETIDIDKFPQHSAGSKRALGGANVGADLPPMKRPRLSRNTLMDALLSSDPRAIDTQAVNRAPTAHMMAPLTTPAVPNMPPSTFGKVHLDRLAQIGPPSPEQPAPTYEPEVTGSNSIVVSATRTSSVKAEFKEISDGFANPQPRTIPLQFPRPQIPTQPTPPFLVAVQPGVKSRKKQRMPPNRPNRPNRPNATAPVAVRAPADLTHSSEEARLSSALQYCKTLFEDIMAGRNVPNAAQMGVTAIQHALSDS